MLELLQNINHWHWFSTGLILLALELLGTGGYLLWFGIAAVEIGAITMLFPIGWQAQWSLFVVQSLLCTWLWSKYQNARDKLADQNSTLNKRHAQLMGANVELLDDVHSGVSHIKLNDSIWQVRCSQELKAGSKVTIVGEEDASLTVKSHQWPIQPK